MSTRTTITSDAAKGGMTLRELDDFVAQATAAGADREQVVKARVTFAGTLRSLTITGGTGA